MSKDKYGYIAVDFDGTLATYHGWTGPLSLGEPIKPMVERVKGWLALGYTVKIFTARIAVEDAEHKMEIIRAIQAWCLKHIGQELEVTNIKDFGMIELYDDRAVTVEENTGRLLASSTRGLPV